MRADQPRVSRTCLAVRHVLINMSSLRTFMSGTADNPRGEKSGLRKSYGKTAGIKAEAVARPRRIRARAASPVMPWLGLPACGPSVIFEPGEACRRFGRGIGEQPHQPAGLPRH